MIASRVIRSGAYALAGMALAIATSLAAPAALAADTSPSAAPKCPGGTYYSERCGACAKRCASGTAWSCSRKSCVKRSGLNLNDSERFKEAVSLARDGQYTGALEMLWSMSNRDTPDVLTYIGYSTRKLGNVDAGIGYYHKALALDPDHARAREYLGEGYLQKGDLDAAKGQLAEIGARCGTGCREYALLSDAIVEHVTGETAASASWH